MRPGKHLVLAADILDVWAMWQVGFAGSVAVLSETISFTQADHLVSRLDEDGTLLILTEDDEANASFFFAQEPSRCSAPHGPADNSRSTRGRVRSGPGWNGWLNQCKLRFDSDPPGSLFLR